jgi:hypothetical protein
MGRYMMRRYVGYALMLIAATTLLVWGVSQFVQPILLPQINSVVVLFFVALLSVTGFLAAFKNTIELVQKFIGRTTQGDTQNIIIKHYFSESGKKSPGLLEVSDIQVKPNRDGTCIADFRVSNTGGSEVLINRVEFEALEVVGTRTLGFMEFSKVYDLELSEMRNAGDTATCEVSQVVKPGDADRFGIILIARSLGIGWFRGWILQPTLYTNFGNVAGEPIEVWLPHSLDINIEEAKKRIDELRAEMGEGILREAWYSVRDSYNET